MVFIGIDTHKSSLAVCIVDELGRQLAVESFANDPRRASAAARLGERGGAGAAAVRDREQQLARARARRSTCSSRARTSAMCAVT